MYLVTLLGVSIKLFVVKMIKFILLKTINIIKIWLEYIYVKKQCLVKIDEIETNWIHIFIVNV